MIVMAKRASALLYRFLKTSTHSIYLLPANVCPVVPLTFIKAGVSFNFVDINQDTLCLDEERVVEILKAKPGCHAGIVFVRTYGYLYNASRFFSEVRALEPGLKIIDDKCLCYPDFTDNFPEADMELYSTGCAKTVDIGHGGFAKLKPGTELKWTDEAFNPGSYKLLERKYKLCLEERKLLGTHPGDWLDLGEPPMTLQNYREKVIAAMEEASIHKKEINEVYKELMPASLPLKDEFQDWRFNILTDKKESILKSVFQSGLFASSHYIPSNILFNYDHFPVADRLSRNVINLFNDHHFSVEQARMVSKLISTFS